MSKKNRDKNRAPKLLQPEKFGAIGDDVLDQIEADDDDDDDFDPAHDQVQIVNVYAGTVKFDIAGRRYKLKTGEIALVEGAYGTPRVFRPGADPLPSVVELETGRKVLPVLDPRVDKDEDGIPALTKQMRARRERAAPPMNQPQI